MPLQLIAERGNNVRQKTGPQLKQSIWFHGIARYVKAHTASKHKANAALGLHLTNTRTGASGHLGALAYFIGVQLMEH